jgi:oligoendopeptidase F
MREKLNSLSLGTPKSTAEVASIFMQDFVFKELIKEASDELKLSILISKLKDDINTVIRQTALYNFETQLHKEFRYKGYLSKEEIGKIFLNNMSKYMGDSVKQSSGSENWWMYIPHVRYMFYVYSYSMGALISKALQNGVRKDPKFIEKVKEFLSAGTSDSPKNLFLKLGIDITKKEFWNAGLDEVEELLNEAEALAKKLGKI